ncbi:hypothetical protein EVAR_33101_1 [Eumeta japonica]|uniref:Uncharacterized protein n=1 Tax=Eumeta variegata TaxID=151549 RepID=A0A4C1YBL9_EUMVA|nr:hypothetical protein EVAR_33101_1 [Eumeta japonica]
MKLVTHSTHSLRSTLIAIIRGLKITEPEETVIVFNQNVKATVCDVNAGLLIDTNESSRRRSPAAGAAPAHDDAAWTKSQLTAYLRLCDNKTTKNCTYRYLSKRSSHGRYHPSTRRDNYYPCEASGNLRVDAARNCRARARPAPAARPRPCAIIDEPCFPIKAFRSSLELCLFFNLRTAARELGPPHTAPAGYRGRRARRRGRHACTRLA